MKYHPDRSKEPDAEEWFKEIAEAYAVPSDPTKRAEYDAHGFTGVAGFSPEDLWGGIDFGDLSGTSASAWARACSIACSARVDAGDRRQGTTCMSSWRPPWT